MRTDARFVVVDAVALDDLCELSARAAGFLERANTEPALVGAMRGAIAEVRICAIPEP